MNKLPLPRYHNDLAEFLGDLRSIVFTSQARTAHHLQLAHTTISRYENGHLKPPPGYLAYLAYMIDDHSLADETTFRQDLLDEINSALRWNYDTQAQFQDWTALRASALTYKKPDSTDEETELHSRIDWGEAPDTSIFFGREDELKKLNKLVITDQHRMLLIVGMAGIGKTSLAARLAKDIQEDFDYVLWRSLRNAPQLDQLLHDIVIRFSADIDVNNLQTLDQKISYLLDFMRRNRCLLLLDNLESILGTGSRIGHYRTGYEPFDSFLRSLANTQHQSCVMLTSRETPSGLEHFSPEQRSVYIHQLQGLGLVASQQLLIKGGVTGVEVDFERLRHLYSGNALALKLVKNTILKFFGGDTALFLEQGSAIFTDVRQLLNKSYERLTPLAREILYWLAIERIPVSVGHIVARLMPQRSNGEVLDALHFLERSSLIELNEWGSSLQNVISEYIIDRLVAEIYTELESEELQFLYRLALLTTDAAEAIRKTQLRLIVRPIGERLVQEIKLSDLRAKFNHLLTAIREQSMENVGYAAGNLLNVMLHTNHKIHNFDFSNMLIQHAYLEDATLTDIDFTGSEFAHCLFNNAFVGINTVALSPNARLLALAAGNEIRIWGLWNRQLHHILRGHEEMIWDIAFLDDENYLFSRDNHAIHLWHIASGKIEHTINDRYIIRSMVLDRTKSLLAAGNNKGIIFVWDIKTNDLLATIDENINSKIYTLAFGVDGQYLAAGDKDGLIRLWSMNPLKLIATFDKHDSSITALAFLSEQGILVSGSANGQIGLWNLANFELERMISAHHGMISGIKSNDNQRFFSSSYDKTIHIWDIAQLDPLLTLHGHDLPISAIDTNDSGSTLVGGGYDRLIHLWNTRNGHLIDTIAGLTLEIRSIAFSPDSKTLAAGSTDYRIYSWDWSSDTRLQMYTGHSRWISSLAFHPHGHQIATGSYDRSVRLWNSYTNQELAILDEQQYWVYCVDFSADGQWIAAGSVDETICIWKSDTLVLAHTLQAHKDGVHCISFHPHQPHLISGGKDRSLMLWDVEKEVCLTTLMDLADSVQEVRFRNDDVVICVLKNGQVILWDIASNTVDDTWYLPATIVQVVAFSPNGHLLAHYEAHVVKIYDIEQQTVIQELQIHGERVTCLAFDSSSDLVASGSVDGYVNIWDIATGQQRRILKMNRPYEGMNITHARGISATQREMLKVMGAVEHRN